MARKAKVERMKATAAVSWSVIGLEELPVKRLARAIWHTERKKMNIKYEGESPDVIDNKEPDFLSHDVHDK